MGHGGLVASEHLSLAFNLNDLVISERDGC